MTNHTVKLGECMSSLTYDFGFSDYKIIYDDGANAALKKSRKNPNVLAEGDTVAVPDRKRKDVDKATGASHKFKLKLPHAVLRIVVRDKGKGLAGKKYKLTVGARVFNGKSGGDGKIEHPIPLDAKTGKLELWIVEGDGIDGYLFELEIGALEHESVPRACQARLLNLGFDCGRIDGNIGDRSKEAIKAFQKAHGVAENPALDNATMNKLREIHEGS